MINYHNISVSESSPTEPVSLAESKAWLQIDFTDHDGLLTGMITGARQSVEMFTGRALVNKSVTLDIETTKDDTVMLPYGTPQNLVINELDDEDAESLLVAAIDYYVRGSNVRLVEGRYSVAYDVEPEVPEALKEAIKMELAERYARRGETEKEYASSVNGLSEAAMAKAQPYRIIWL